MNQTILLSREYEFTPYATEYEIHLPTAYVYDLQDVLIQVRGGRAGLEGQKPTRVADVRIYLDSVDITSQFRRSMQSHLDGLNQEVLKGQYKSALDSWFILASKYNPSVFPGDREKDRLKAQELVETKPLSSLLHVLGDTTAGAGGHLDIFLYLYAQIAVPPVSLGDVVRRYNKENPDEELFLHKDAKLVFSSGPCRFFYPQWQLTNFRPGFLEVQLQVIHANPEDDLHEGTNAPSSKLFELEDALPPEGASRPEVLSPLAQAVYAKVTSERSMQGSQCPLSLMLTHGNVLSRIIMDGPAIFGGFAEELAQAKHLIYMSFFKWDPETRAADLIGEGLKKAAAASTGKIVVRMVVDDMVLNFGRPINHLYDSVKKWGISADKMEFQLATYPRKSVGILHEKMIVVDCETLLITGANLEDDHNPPSPWRDLGFVVKGPAALSAAASFDNCWDFHAKHWNCVRRRFYDCRRSRHPAISREWLSIVPYEPNGCSVIAAGRLARGNWWDGKDNPQNEAWRSVFKQSATEILIITPNIDAEEFVDLLIESLVRGVAVKLLTSKDFNEKFFVNWFFESNEKVVGIIKERVRRLGLQTYDLQIRWYRFEGRLIEGNGDRASHCKFLTADGALGIVGSGNMDGMSWWNSREFNIVLDGEAETQRLNDEVFWPNWKEGLDALA